MIPVDDARAGLAEITKRRNQVIDGASRGRHRGWNAAGMLAMIAGFAAMDLPASSVLQLSLFGVAMVAALVCFTQAGRRGKALIHQSQMDGRFWAVLGGSALVFGVLAFGGLRLLDHSGLPLSHALFGVLFTVLIAVTEPVYRALLRRTAA
ncbi:hypothetical protein [Thermostaphylospora chromogena]|uniref:Uncharacterized protein n=1 Tax=Thermostaphylospora chromogena TaxID=35622 RepID=A0A1H1EPP6_9ACTN|nr:hypothetical protein [Thermostaphylospora chromogena]SDQ90735.1 hypothetical protein SAMN04489764_2576 [Thermostaphylospora chromogena]